MAAERSPLPGALAVGLFVVLAGLLASAAPLLAYAGSLALFGLPHVLAELRYVDGRFGRRLGRSQVALILALLGVAVLVRILSMADLADPRGSYVAELGIVAVMAFVAVPALAATPGRAFFALLVGGLIASGSWRAPLLTVVVLSVLHNLTPVGFLFERLWHTAYRRRVCWSVALLFGGVPVLLATGGLASLLSSVGLSTGAAGFASVGVLASHRGVFVPRGWFDAQTATQIFGAVAYLQLLHYGTVLLVLPRLLAAGEGGLDRPLLPWPPRQVLALGIAAVGLLATVLFVQDFRGTRAAYGLVASVHAWIEIPILLLALTPLRAPAAASASAA